MAGIIQLLHALRVAADAGSGCYRCDTLVLGISYAVLTCSKEVAMSYGIEGHSNSAFRRDGLAAAVIPARWAGCSSHATMHCMLQIEFKFFFNDCGGCGRSGVLQDSPEFITADEYAIAH